MLAHAEQQPAWLARVHTVSQKDRCLISRGTDSHLPACIALPAVLALQRGLNRCCLCGASMKQACGHAPDARLATTLIRVCSQHGQALGALALYDWMRAGRAAGGAALIPTVFTYTAAMRAGLAGNLLQRAYQVSCAHLCMQHAVLT